MRYITKACKFGKYLEIAFRMAIASTALGPFLKIKHTQKHNICHYLTQNQYTYILYVGGKECNHMAATLAS